MQVLVLYYSKGGNTKRLAEEVAKGVESAKVKAVMKSTSEVTKEDFLESDGIIAGSPVYFGVMAWELKKIFDEFVGT
ncbi:MAG: flavodoxin family protein, partial [Nitrospiraceae bacterium]